MNALGLGENIVDRYAKLQGNSSGFDYLRIVLATVVVIQHSIVVTDYPLAVQLWEGPVRMLLGPVLLVFFSLSGFLVAGSLSRRPSVSAFATLRFARLGPALAVGTLFSALLLGPSVTDLPLAEYFASKDFWHFFGNGIGRIHYRLPGVFTEIANEGTRGIVNLQLWTIPFQLECYGALIAAFVLGIFTRRTLFLGAAVALFALGNYALFDGFEPDYEQLQSTVPVGHVLVMSFIAGAAIHLYGDRIRLHWAYALICAALTAILSRRFEFSYVATIPAAYLTVYLGLSNPRRSPIVLSGDYSYGLFIFAFPIEQIYCFLFPNSYVWYCNAGFSLFFGLLLATFSWWCIERPVLSRKEQLVRFVHDFRDACVSSLARLVFGNSRSPLEFAQRVAGSRSAVRRSRATLPGSDGPAPAARSSRVP